MCNKYASESKVNEYEKHDLVEYYNKCMDDFDFELESKYGNSLCLSCIKDCKGICKDNKCVYFERMYTKEEYNKMIKEENVGIHELCKLYMLDKNRLCRMLKGKERFNEYYARCLNSRLEECEEFIPYLDVTYG